MGFKDFIGNAWNKIKDTASDTWNNSKKIADNVYSKVKYYGKQAIDANRRATEDTAKTVLKYGGKALNFLDRHKADIAYYGGKALKVYGVATENPIAIAGGTALSGFGRALKEDDAKEEEKLKEERRLALYGNRYVAYSDMPRIHYSRRPFGYGIPSITPHLYKRPNYSMMNANPQQSPLKLAYQEHKPKSKSKTKGKGKKK